MYERKEISKLEHIINMWKIKHDIEFGSKRKEINNRHYRKRKDKQHANHNDNLYSI